MEAGTDSRAGVSTGSTGMFGPVPKTMLGIYRQVS
jgi:hypothetical protein